MSTNAELKEAILQILRTLEALNIIAQGIQELSEQGEIIITEENHLPKRK